MTGADGPPLAGPAPTTGEHTVTADCDLERAGEGPDPRDDALANRRPDVCDLE